MPTKELPPQAAIRGAVENGGAEGWRYKDLASQLYRMADTFSFYFLSPRTPKDLRIPQLVLAFDQMDVRINAWYRLDHNAHGLKWEVGLNAKHCDRPYWSLCESLLHEMFHLYQESMVELGVEGFKSCRGGYHNQQFIDLCEQAGLHPRLGVGSHWKVADGQFARLMDRYCIAPPPAAEVPKDQPKTDWWFLGTAPKKGGSTLIKYGCESCTNSRPCTFRGGHRNLNVLCGDCGGQFKPE